MDDDRRLGALLSAFLVKHRFDTVAFEMSKPALAWLRSNSVDLVLLDVMLPDGDGFEICRSIRARSQTPIIMLTAMGEEPDRVLGLELGADDYLPKPFGNRELLARIRAVLRRVDARPTRLSERLSFGDLELDRGSRTLTVDGERRELTRHQFDLLWVLFSNPGRVLSRQELLAAASSDPSEVFDRSIDAHIFRLRAAIERDSRRPRRIKTVRGVGYVFTPDEGEGR